MELYLQYGYGMRPTCIELLKAWRKGTVILSPRDISQAQLKKTASDFKKVGAHILFDPQFYAPRSDHETLCGHDYWPNQYETGSFWEGAGLKKLLQDVFMVNQVVGSEAVILPATYTDELDDYWLEDQLSVNSMSKELISGIETYSTVALGANVLKDDKKIQELLDASLQWESSGIYLIGEHPKAEYLVSDPSWLANLLELIASFRLGGKRVILGYANHQMLITALASVNAIASGSWMNVRNFTLDKFSVPKEDQVKTTTNWFYCPQALSEYKIQFLDVADIQGVLGDMKPDVIYGDYTKDLFADQRRPSVVGLQQRESFLHYLNCLKIQCELSRLDSFEGTVRAHEQLLTSSEGLLEILQSRGVRGQKRDFYEYVDINRAALSIFQNTSAPMIRRQWTNLN